MTTLAERAYHEIRRDVLRGAFAPGQPLRLADLSERYGMGFSPLREALNRLQAERLVTAETLRGFRVAPLSLEAFEDALATRLVIEGEALRQSLARGGDDWEAGVVAALHALQLQAGRAGEEGALWELEARHHAFHRALLAACGSGWLMEFFERLYAATERYRLPVLLAEGAGGAGAGRDIGAEHQALAEAALARDAARAGALLTAHYARTGAAIRDRLGTGPALWPEAPVHKRRA